MAIASCLLVSAALLADCDDCYVDPPCCDMGSCEIPMGNQCLEYECYMPAFYDLSCGSGRFLRLEYLRWYGRDINQAYALTATATPSSPDTDPLLVEPEKYHYIKPKWENGARITMGRHSSCDGWDSNISWTYYQNKTTSSVSVPPFALPNPEIPASAQPFLPGPFEKVLINPWINQSFTPADGLSSFYFTSISAKSKFRIHQLDLELGRKYWLSRCFLLRPFVGGRAVDIHTNFETSSFNVSGPLEDRFTNKTKAAGLIGGLEPSFYLTSNFVLFGKINLALVWGQFKMQKRENYFFQPDPLAPPQIDYKHKMKSSFYGMEAGMGAQSGLRWEVCWCQDQFRTALDIGWEHQIWFDQSIRHLTFENSTNPGLVSFNFFDQTTSNLAMGGLFVRAQLDF